MRADLQIHAGIHYPGFLFAIAILLASCEIATIRPIDPATGKAIIEESVEKFDPAIFAAEIWEKRLMDTLEEHAHDIAILLQEIERDPDFAAERFGHREAGRSPSFLTRGRGIVTRVDTSSRAGMIDVDLEPADGITDLQIQIGPVIRGTALRDALPFISFNVFDNQLEHAAVSRELHLLVVDSVLTPVDRPGLDGATISFTGAFTLTNDRPLVLTPTGLVCD
jgi:predicted lipoprotein